MKEERDYINMKLMKQGKISVFEKPRVMKIGHPLPRNNRKTSEQINETSIVKMWL